jgi:hypothetical protein
LTRPRLVDYHAPSNDEPGRHRRNLDRSPVVARIGLCGAMARLID